VPRPSIVRSRLKWSYGADERKPAGVDGDIHERDMSAAAVRRRSFVPAEERHHIFEILHGRNAGKEAVRMFSN